MMVTSLPPKAAVASAAVIPKQAKPKRNPERKPKSEWFKKGSTTGRTESKMGR
jgi:ATP-dependent RNA helicase RhlE